MTNYLIVSVHDITSNPAKRSNYERIFEALDTNNVGRFSVALIPAYYDANTNLHTADEGDFGPAFKSWIGNKGAVAVHGFTHEKKGVWAREFSIHDKDELERRLECARNVFDNLGFTTETFVPPFWDLSKEGFEVASTRYQVIPVYDGIHDTRYNQRFIPAKPIHDSPHLTSGYHLGRKVGDALTRKRAKKAEDDQLVRMVIHAHDIEKLGQNGILSNLLKQYADQGRKLTTYAEVVQLM